MKPPSSSSPLRRLAGAARATLAACLLALASLAALAQETDDVPARVGRVASVLGALYQATGRDAQEWAPIGVNDPVAQGDDLWTDAGSRAEVDYGGGQFRLAGGTSLHVARLDERQIALFVAAGRLLVRVRYLEAGDSVRIDTPSTQVALERPGLYRIDVDAEPARTTLAVREGAASVATTSGAEPVYPGEVAVLAGTQDVVAQISKGGAQDEFDAWSAARDREYEAPPSPYVSPEMVGGYDLGAYGEWRTYPEYGAVWFPTVDPGWAPYRFGHWTWLRAYGYAWVDDAPWGYAPFHYGRWAHVGGRWGWCPGAYVRRPLWAPALVAWYGGAALAYGGSGPVYGWVPLGWGEAYVPWWRGCASRCYARYNRPYAVDVSRRVPEPPRQPVNWSAPGGVTAIPAGAVAAGRPVAVNRVPISPGRAVPPALAAPPAIAPVIAKPGVVRPGAGVPLPAAELASRPSGAVLPPRVPASPLPGARGPVAPPQPAAARAAPPSSERSLTVRPAPQGQPVPPPRAAPLPSVQPPSVPQPTAPPPAAPLRAVPPPPAPAPLRMPSTPLPMPSVPQPLPAPVAPPRVVPATPVPAPAAPAPVRPPPAPGAAPGSGGSPAPAVPVAPPPARNAG